MNYICLLTHTSKCAYLLVVPVVIANVVLQCFVCKLRTYTHMLILGKWRSKLAGLSTKCEGLTIYLTIDELA